MRHATKEEARSEERGPGPAGRSLSRSFRLGVAPQTDFKKASAPSSFPLPPLPSQMLLRPSALRRPTVGALPAPGGRAGAPRVAVPARRVAAPPARSTVARAAADEAGAAEDAPAGFGGYGE